MRRVRIEAVVFDCFACLQRERYVSLCSFTSTTKDYCADRGPFGPNWGRLRSGWGRLRSGWGPFEPPPSAAAAIMRCVCVCVLPRAGGGAKPWGSLTNHPHFAPHICPPSGDDWAVLGMIGQSTPGFPRKYPTPFFRASPPPRSRIPRGNFHFQSRSLCVFLFL